jgi:hypothetical protein
MSLNIFPNAFRKIVKACGDVNECSGVNARRDVKTCSDVKTYSAVKACSDVEERRFSAASSAPDDVGFSPSGRTLRRSQPFPHLMRQILTGTLSAVALLTLSAASPFSARAQKIAADLPSGTMQAKATTACTECHDARIILQQRLSKTAWTKEVDKMIRWGALVDPADRDSLIDYLSTNFSPDKPAYEPQRTSAEKRASGKPSK